MHPPHQADERPLPQWLPTDGSWGWADMHVHGDPPMDLDGLKLRPNMNLGSDMAKVALLEQENPGATWVAAIDQETNEGLLVCCILLPPCDSSTRDSTFDVQVTSVSAPAELASMIDDRWGGDASLVSQFVRDQLSMTG